MFSFFKKFFDYNQQELNRISKIVEQINELEDEARGLDDKDFKSETEMLRNQIEAKEKTLEEILPWSFALVREAARRSLGQRHYDVQMAAGIAMHEGKVVEQKTGEGKTLTATAPLYLNALTGKGVHLVTVNDYLARRDAGWMGKVFNFLGMSTSAIISNQSFLYDTEFHDSDAHDPRLAHLRPVSRKKAYEADVTYGINSEFGFDYLRDNMAHSADRMVQRSHYYSIVDEADSVLIDEARTPHIISAPVEQDTTQYYEYAKIVDKLNPEKDFTIDEKLRTAHLSEEGVETIEKILGIENIYEKDFETLFHIEAALKAKALFQHDKDYIVRNGEVIIVDEFTGRLLEGRRYSEGLHQAIEAKEGVSIKQESKTLATVSLQNYFRMYEKLAGMTGTASTEAEEFNKIYGVDVLVVPTHRPNQRTDHGDVIYKTERAKYNAVVNDIAEQYKKGRPVLVGTTSIDKNELVSKLLNQKGIPHELLNAKNHEREAHIISQAGKKQAVTVATNMAGRGVDIVLGGEVREDDYESEEKYKKALQEWQEEHDEIVKLGGLYVIGTERHESRRIDNQLRGRSGRQGDPGETKFFVALEDDLMRIFGGEQISNLMNMLKFPEDQPLSHGMVTRAIEQAQVKVEGFNFDTRKRLVEYDDVLNRQRDIIYALRRKILFTSQEASKKFRAMLEEIIDEQVAGVTASYFALKNTDESVREQFEDDIHILTNVETTALETVVKNDDQEELEKFLSKHIWDAYNVNNEKVEDKVWQHVVCDIFLSTIDQYWTEHLTAIDDLRQGINLRGYAQMDPLVEYKNEAFKMFEKLLTDVKYESIRRLVRIQVQPRPQAEQKNEVSTLPDNAQYQSASRVNPFNQVREQEQEPSQAQNPLRTIQIGQTNAATHASSSAKRPGRNDPCWCGSGKKYKKCHYPN